MKFQEGNAHKFESLLEYKLKHLRGDMLSVRCAFESQQPNVCDLVIKSGESGTLSFVAVSALSDFNAIDYVITNSSIPVNSLNFDRCSSGGVEVVLAKQQHYPHLQKLDLDVMDIDDGCVVPLAVCLKHFPNLRKLCFGINNPSANIGTNCAKALAGGLKHCRDLQSLGLRVRRIGKEGAIALAEGLEHWPDLKELDLAFNRIGADGAKVLANCLKHCPGLQDLSLALNGFGADGAMAIADDLKHCPGLPDTGSCFEQDWL